MGLVIVKILYLLLSNITSLTVESYHSTWQSISKHGSAAFVCVGEYLSSQRLKGYKISE